MSFYNRLLEVFLLPVGDFVTGGSFIRQLHAQRRLLKKNEAELKALQKAKLADLLAYAVKNSTYYRNTGILVNASDPEKSLKAFPILTKKLLARNQDSLLTVPVNARLIKQSSSGSSGVQSVVYWSRQEQSLHRATQILWWEWAGYKPGNHIIQTGLSFNRSLFKRIKDLLFRTEYVLAFSHDEKDIEKALRKIRKDGTTVLGGYASSLYVISQIAIRTGTTGKLKTVISWGDKMFDHYRKSIFEAFGAKVHETYATTEGMMIAAQKDLDYMYIMSPNVYLEILDDDGNEVPDGEMGHIVVTNLNGFAMPLIRYKIGDIGIKLPRNLYPTKRELAFPILQKVIGRDTDIVKTRSGKSLIVHSFTGIFEYAPEIEQFCVIQNNLDGILIKYIPAAGFSEDLLEGIRKKILDHLNEDFSITFERTNFIAPTKSGKPQIIVSNL